MIRSKYKFTSLEVGQSMTLFGNLKTIASAACMYGKRKGIKLSCSKINIQENGQDVERVEVKRVK